MPPAANPNLYTLDSPLTSTQVLDELAATPKSLRSLLAGVPPGTLSASPDPDGWSAFETLCHFRDAALVYALRFRFIVFDQDPLLPNYDENNWVAAAHDRPEELTAILDEIAASRSDLVRVLRNLHERFWQRTGRHEVIGPVVLEDYVRHQLAHERAHLAQIREAIAAAT
ncbi:MAG: DinB family protein [Dehalococcoidia bacterium]